jgi:signal transduction histidine kinase
VLTSVFLALVPFATGAPVFDEHELSTTIRFVAQSLLMFVSFGVFFIIWLPPGRPKDYQSAFIAVTFFATGVLTFAHILTCRELLSALGSAEEPVGSYFHMMSTVVMAIGLATAAFIPSKRKAPRREMRLLFLASAAITVALLAIPVILGHSLPSLCPHAAPDCPIRISMELAAISALVLGSIKYFMLTLKSNDMLYAYLGSATVAGFYTHLVFSMHDNPYDTCSLLALIFSVICYSFVFVALFRGEIIQPYRSLNASQRQAERRRKEAEAATVKAQTYLDFLSHDVANMISPIMNRAEMILRSPNVTEKEREEAHKIVEQTQKVSSLIVNLRRLSSAEKIDARMLGPVDLRVLLTDLEKTRRESHRNLDLNFAFSFPEDSEIKVRGGSVTEDIIAEIIDNAIKHTKKDFVEVEVDVYASKGDSQEDNWTIEVRDHGPGIPDQTKKALDVASPDPKRRFTRGIASSLSVIPLIAEQLGGRIRIEDRVPGDYTQGTKVIITLPRAP